jgi:hypothetical protein
MNTVFFLRLGALALLALGSVLVLRVVVAADAAAAGPKLVSRRRRPAPDAPSPDPLRKAA